ncbi:Protein of unknown function [Pedobacter suwonensis]|uniref:DUF3347 domain-containing protein n=1 Tax=Pedobacter suwonensis TaxID=332999 RepID=A0A1I0TRL8_9SPHI|nr:DUF3347 domain-containing protein [Pedobacter suwonensis]SFA54398.1 Protein of unknown function [Pedobacter suwonensis]
MKKYTLAAVMVVTGLIFNAKAQVKTSSQEVTPELVKQRETQKNTIIASYLAIKDGLVISDAKKTAGSATEFSAALGQFKFKKLTLQQMNVATTTRISIKALADQIAASSSLDEQRKIMEKLSEQLWVIIDKLKPENTTVYQQKCPMTGVTWVSNDKKIENPYYPKNMLTCGEVIGEK